MSDAATTLFSDSLENLVSNLGTSKDKATGGVFRTRLLSRGELEALYTGNWIAGVVVDAIADDMTRAWREWQAKQSQIEAIEDAERKLDVRATVARALKMARLYGGAGILIGTGDPHPELPLDTSTIQKGGLKYLTALTPWELTAPEMDRDPTTANFGKPKSYYLNGTMNGPLLIHPSRVVRFTGIELLDREQSGLLSGWGLSVLHRVYDAIRNAESAGQSMASLLQEAKTDVISVPDLTNQISDPMFRDALLKRFTLANISKSINNTLLLDSGEVWTQKQLNFSGLPEVLKSFLETCAGAAGMPVTRLLGKSPSGLNSSGDAEIRHYYDTLSSRQETDLRPALESLDDALVRHALGKRPKNVTYRFSSLWQLSDDERAKIAEGKAKASAIYSKEGLMDIGVLRQAVRMQLIEDGTYPGLNQLEIPAVTVTRGEEALNEGVKVGAQSSVQEKVS